MKVKTKNMQTRKAAKITRRKVANFSTVEGQQQGVRIEGMRKTVRKLILSLRKQHRERKQYEERSEAAINRLTANTDQLQSKLANLEEAKKTQQRIEMLPIRMSPAREERPESPPARPPRLVSPIQSPSPRRLVRDRSPVPARQMAARSPSPFRRIRDRSPSPARQMAARSPSPARQMAARTPSPARQMAVRSPSPARRLVIHSPSPVRQRVARSPSPDRQRVARSPSPVRQEVARSPSPARPMAARSPSPNLEINIEDQGPRWDDTLDREPSRERRWPRRPRSPEGARRRRRRGSRSSTSSGQGTSSPRSASPVYRTEWLQLTEPSGDGKLVFKTGLVNRFLRVHMLLGKITNYRIRSRRSRTNTFRIAIEHTHTRQDMARNVQRWLDGSIAGKQPIVKTDGHIRESEWTKMFKEKNICVEL